VTLKESANWDSERTCHHFQARAREWHRLQLSYAPLDWQIRVSHYGLFLGFVLCLRRSLVYYLKCNDTHPSLRNRSFSWTFKAGRCCFLYFGLWFRRHNFVMLSVWFSCAIMKTPWWQSFFHVVTIFLYYRYNTLQIIIKIHSRLTEPHEWQYLRPDYLCATCWSKSRGLPSGSYSMK
jgi:hypothetical protein